MVDFGFPAVAWASDCDVLRIEARFPELTVEIKVLDWHGSEVYKGGGKYVVVDGVVLITGLQEMLNRYCLLGVNHRDALDYSGVDPWVTFCYYIAEEDFDSQTKVYYNRRLMKWGPGDDFQYWAVQERDRKVLPGMRCGLYFDNNAALTVRVGLAYVDTAGEVRYSEKTVDYDNDQRQWVMIDGSIDGAVGYVLDAGSAVGRVLYADYMLDDGKVVTDKVRVTPLDNAPAHSVEVIFLNMFGVYETLLMTGSDTENVELEASYGYANGKMVRTDAICEVSHEMHSGWLSRARYATVIDMCESPWVAVKAADGGWREIVVTELKAERVRPNNMPDDVVVSWRYAERIGQMRAVFEPVNPAADDVFDYSFDRVFD